MNRKKIIKAETLRTTDVDDITSDELGKAYYVAEIIETP